MSLTIKDCIAKSEQGVKEFSIMKSTALLIIAATLAASQANSRLEIEEISGEEFTTNLRCRENVFDLEPTLLHNISLFLRYNGTSRQVVTLFGDNNVQYEFDDNSDGTLRFDARQDIEGYYYCSRNISAGVPSDEDLFKTVVGKFLTVGGAVL